MITVNSKGAIVTVTVEAQYPISDIQFDFTFNTGREYVARLLVYNLENNLSTSIEKVRKQAYDQGWSDAKKHQVKKNWFSGLIIDKYPFGFG